MEYVRVLVSNVVTLSDGRLMVHSEKITKICQWEFIRRENLLVEECRIRLSAAFIICVHFQYLFDSHECKEVCNQVIIVLVAKFEEKDGNLSRINSTVVSFR